MDGKAVLEENINQRLGTDIRWRELDEDDLETFYELLKTEQFVKIVAGQYANDAAGKEVQKQVEQWQPGQFAMKAIEMTSQSDEPE